MYESILNNNSLIGSRLLNTDSYKAGHSSMYPNHKYMSAYVQARKPLDAANGDERIIHMGGQYFYEKYLAPRLTHEEIDKAVEFYNSHYLGNPYPFPEQLFRDIVNENDGIIPIQFKALDEGQPIVAGTPQATLTAEGKYAPLVTFFETALLQCIWYQSTVATISAQIRLFLEGVFERASDNPDAVGSRLHDFGYRGTTSEEQAILGGVAHLMSFSGTDTIPAAYLAGGVSIPATEHSVMMSWPTELDAVMNMVELYGDGVFATVADTYDYENFLNEIVPKVAPLVKAKGGYHVVRPDSGDPLECVLQGLEALSKHYGYTLNSKGYKVINNAGVIQGDGIDFADLVRITNAVVSAGYAPDNVAFGMGSGLLQKVNRDTLSYAMKLSYVVDANNDAINLMKAPATDMKKASLPGEFHVQKVASGNAYIIETYPLENAPQGSHGEASNSLKSFPVSSSFDQVRSLVNTIGNLDHKNSGLSIDLLQKKANVYYEIRKS